MKIVRNIFIAILPFLISSCYSTLQVRVDALDMAKMKASNQYKQEERARELAYYNSRLKSKYYSETQKFLDDKVRKFLSSDTTFDQSVLDKVTALTDSAIHTRLNELKRSESSVRDALQNLINVPDSSLQKRYDSSFADFALQKQRITGYLDSLGNEANISEEDRNIFRTNTEIFKNSITPPGIYGNAITDDRMASFVAKVPEEFWQKYKSSFYEKEDNLTKSEKKARINRTGITTVIGNSDVAVKMDGPGNFVIKGVRLDADQAFRTSFKVLSQSIQYFAATAAIPVTPKTPDATATEGTGISVPELQALQGNKQTAANMDAQYVQLTNTFLNILDTYKADLTSSNSAKRYEAIKAVKAAYLFYKSQITVQ